MYSLINHNAVAVFKALDSIGDLNDYLRLRSALLRGADSAHDAEFQRGYRRYWRMNAARLGSSFYDQYFTQLAECRRSNAVDLPTVARCISTVNGVTVGLQFSFATKLAHMIEPRIPVYDSFVASFYFFVPPPPHRPFDERLSAYLEFHQFVAAEYSRVIREGLLGGAIDYFRRTSGIGEAMPDERIIDWLIWAWVDLLRRGAHRRGEALYQ